MQETHKVPNIPRYGWICLNTTGISLNMSEFKIIDKVLIMAGFWMWLKQYKAQGHSTGQLVLIERQAYSEPCQRSKIEFFGKTIVVFKYFCKILHLKSLTGSEYLSGFKYVSILNIPAARVVNMPGFWISSITQGLPIFVNMQGFWLGVGMQLWKGPEYSRFPNMPGFCICEGYTGSEYAGISLNISW